MSITQTRRKNALPLRSFAGGLRLLGMRSAGCETWLARAALRKAAVPLDGDQVAQLLDGPRR